MKPRGRVLIINADDLGIGRRVSDGIFDCHEGGAVTSTTLMANMPAAEYAAQAAARYPRLGIGVHLNLTAGRPVLPVHKIPDLVDEGGNFNGYVEQATKLWIGRQVYRQVVAELAAQIEKSMDLGISPTHCDSHHGIHRMPLVAAAIRDVISRLPVPRLRNQIRCRDKSRNNGNRVDIVGTLRGSAKAVGHRLNNAGHRLSGIRMPDRQIGYSDGMDDDEQRLRALLNALRKLPHGISELISHPGYEDPDVADSVRFKKVRRADLNLMRNPEVLRVLKEERIVLASYANI